MSSVSNKFITNEQAVPVIDSDIFKGHENSQFALAVLGTDDVLSYKPGSLAEAYLKLRANVYVDQTGMLKVDAKHSDGTEIDADDERSTHFVVCENKMGQAAVFACMRLIEKTNSRDILPIEGFFPYAFEVSAPTKSIEVSRFIVRNDEAKSSRAAKIELITAGLAHTVSNHLGPIYGVAEPDFERSLRLMRMPIRRIAEPKLVPEYNDDNLGFEIDKGGLISHIGELAVKKMTIPEGSFGYWGEMPEPIEDQRQSNG